MKALNTRISHIAMVGLVYVLLTLPFVAFAQEDIPTLITTLGGLLNAVVPLIIGLAVIYFLWGVVQFVMNASDEDAKKKSRDTMIWGIIAIFIATSFWGILGILQGTFSASTTQPTGDDLIVPFPGGDPNASR